MRTLGQELRCLLWCRLLFMKGGRLLLALVTTASLSACSSSKPTEAQLTELRAWSLHNTGDEAFFGSKTKSLTKDEVTCIAKSTWSTATACPAFSRLDLSHVPFDEVYCSKITTHEGLVKSLCDRSWFACNQLRQDNRRVPFLKVDECTVAEPSWELTFSCNGSETCAQYFANADDCRGLHGLLASKTNLTECRERPPVRCPPKQ